MTNSFTYLTIPSQKIFSFDNVGTIFINDQTAIDLLPPHFITHLHKILLELQHIWLNRFFVLNIKSVVVNCRCWMVVWLNFFRDKSRCNDLFFQLESMSTWIIKRFWRHIVGIVTYPSLIKSKFWLNKRN